MLSVAATFVPSADAAIPCQFRSDSRAVHEENDSVVAATPVHPTVPVIPDEERANPERVRVPVVLSNVISELPAGNPPLLKMT